MESNWGDFLNIINIDENSRKSEKLTIPLEFHLGDLEQNDFENLLDILKEIYNVNDFYAAWFKDLPGSSELSFLEMLSFNNNSFEIIQDLWYQLLGNYLLFFPKSFLSFINEPGVEEDIIGKILCMGKILLIKTPDANEVLLLEIK